MGELNELSILSELLFLILHLRVAGCSFQIAAETYAGSGICLRALVSPFRGRQPCVGGGLKEGSSLFR